jgi:hypothetical protein
LEDEINYMWRIGINLIIFDTTKNTVLEKIGIRAFDEYMDPIDPSLVPTEEEINAGLRSWNDILTKHKFTERIDKFNESFTGIGFSLFPYVQNNISYDCHLVVDVEESIGGDPWKTPIIIKWNLLGSNGSQTKILASGREESRGGAGMGGGYAGSKVIGYYKSPLENRLLVVIAHYSAEFEGEIHRNIQLYGFNLDF